MHDTTVVVEDRSDCVNITNALLQVVVDLRLGTFRIADRHDRTAQIDGGDWRITDMSGNVLSGVADTRYASSSEDTNGPLGEGKRVTITGAGPNRIDTILVIELYEGKTYVVLNAGIENRTRNPVRIGSIHPIVGTAFRGQDVANGFAALDGTTGCLPTKVWTDTHVQCRNNILAKFGSNPTRCLVIGGLTYHDFEKFTRIDRRDDCIEFDVWSEDPVGRRVAPGERYLPDDKVYVDISSHDPFAALEQYAWCVRNAQNIELPTYDFPTVCLWWASQVGALANDSPGAVMEMDHVVRSGFLKYSPVGIRLLPDSYDRNNCDGWWDEEHWQKCRSMFAEAGPCYKPPYETTEKWCRAIIERGGVPMGYVRAGARSEDYAEAHPGHMLFNDTNRQISKPFGKRWWEKDWPPEECNLSGYDFTDPDFVEHMKEVYANLRSAGLAGIFYDYPKITGWSHEGGFEDPDATTASAYRNIFRLAQEGLGKGAYLQERAYFLGSDVSAGLVASQRTIWDNTMWAPPVISRAGLRWYKNRVMMNYDTDGKQVADEFARNGRDGVRAMFTMTYVASARLLLANSFTQMTPEHLYDLSRVIPFHSAPQSARPIDLFNGNPYPRVYDFKVDDGWHQLTFYNTAVESGEWPTIDVDLEPFTEGRSDFPPTVRALTPVADTVAVELSAP
ncbi:hypothetical protein ACFLQU_05305, partial [Verrucomicrobiota bacterium]